MPEEKRKTAGVRGVSPEGGKVKTTGGKDLWRRGVLSLEWKREGVMDSDSGDEGNDELTCVRSDKSDKSL